MDRYITPELVYALVMDVPALVILSAVFMLSGWFALRKMDRMADSIDNLSKAMLANTAAMQNNTASTDRSTEVK